MGRRKREGAGPLEALFPVGDAAGLVNRLQFWLADRQRWQAASRAARALAEKQLSIERFRARIRTEIESSLPNGQSSYGK